MFDKDLGTISLFVGNVYSMPLDSLASLVSPGFTVISDYDLKIDYKV